MYIVGVCVCVLYECECARAEWNALDRNEQDGWITGEHVSRQNRAKPAE